MPYLGFGLRLRREYLAPVLESHPPVDWLELIPENYFEADASISRQLDQLSERYPLVLHGVSLAIGSPWPLDPDYLGQLQRLIERLQPAWVSDHLCWDGADDVQGRLLPLPYSEETLDHVVQRTQQVQEILGRQILLENVPAEIQTSQPEMSEAEFVGQVAERSDSLILIDIANLHTTSTNQGFDPMAYLFQLPEARVQQIHLAGAVALCNAEDPGGEGIVDPIWELYTGAMDHFGPVSTLIERVDTIPSLEEMVREVEKARCSTHRYLSSE